MSEAHELGMSTTLSFPSADISEVPIKDDMMLYEAHTSAESCMHAVTADEGDGNYSGSSSDESDESTSQ